MADQGKKRRFRCPTFSSLMMAFLLCLGQGCPMSFALALNVLFNDWMTTFNTSRAAIGSVQATCFGMLSCGALFSAFSVRKLGARTSYILGSVLATVGMFSGAFANSVPVLILTVGAVTGSGFSLNILTTLSTVTTQFASHSGIVSSAIFFATGLMQLGIPILYRYLNDQFFWRGCLMIVAGMTFQTVVIGIFFTSPVSTASKQPNDQQHSTKSVDISISQNDTDTTHVENRVCGAQNYTTEDSFGSTGCRVVPDENEIKATVNTNVEASEQSPQTGVCPYDNVSIDSIDNHNFAMKDGISKPSCDIFPGKNMDTEAEDTDAKACEHSYKREFDHIEEVGLLIDCQNCAMEDGFSETECTIISDGDSETTPGRTTVAATEISSTRESPKIVISDGCDAIPSAGSDPDTDEPRKSSVNTKKSIPAKTRQSQWTFLKNPVYLFVVITFCFTGSAQYGILYLVLDLALNKGWTVDDGLTINFAFMLGSLIGPPVVGLVSLDKRVNSVHLLAICMIAGAVGMGPIGFVTDFYLTASLFFLMGLSIGSMNASHVSAVLYTAGSQSFSMAEGVFVSLEGLMKIGLGSLAGVLVDHTEAYIVPCFGYGVISLTLSIVLIILECCHNPCRANCPEKGR